jgi:hypothetical protein
MTRLCVVHTTWDDLMVSLLIVCVFVFMWL